MAMQSPHRTPGPKLSRSTIFPILGDRSALKEKGHLLPLVVTVFVSVLALPLIDGGLFANLGSNPVAEINEAWQIYYVIAFFIAFLVNHYIYELCGRDRPWWLLVGVALLVAVGVNGPVFHRIWYPLFYSVIPGDQWQLKTNPLAVQLAGWFFGTGLCEESFKALPLLALAFVGWRWKNKLATRIGLFEPLDGILLGVASGSGFFLAETLGQYVPTIMHDAIAPYLQVMGQQGAALGAGEEAYQGLVLLLMRGLPDLAAHSAWAGLFGYFIGLAVLQRGNAIRLLLIGWSTAAALHAAWDGIGVVTNYAIIVDVFQATVGVLSYALLAAAIIKARQLSPTRAFNFATVLRPSELQPPPPISPAPPAPAPAAPAPAGPATAAPPKAAPPPAPHSLVFAIGPVRRELLPDMHLEAQLFGAAGAELGPGPVARVEADPHDPQAWGLVNMTTRSWSVTLPTGNVIELAAGKAVRLSPGLAIDFGGVTGTVEAA